VEDETAGLNPLQQAPPPAAAAAAAAAAEGEVVPPLQARAVLRGVSISPRKLNMFAKVVRGLCYDDALIQCEMSCKKSAGLLRNVLRSARANAINNHGLDADKLVVGALGRLMSGRELGGCSSVPGWRWGRFGRLFLAGPWLWLLAMIYVHSTAQHHCTTGSGVKQIHAGRDEFLLSQGDGKPLVLLARPCEYFSGVAAGCGLAQVVRRCHRRCCCRGGVCRQGHPLEAHVGARQGPLGSAVEVPSPCHGEPPFSPFFCCPFSGVFEMSSFLGSSELAAVAP
jgi:hypothetical protein